MLHLPESCNSYKVFAIFAFGIYLMQYSWRRLSKAAKSHVYINM